MKGGGGSPLIFNSYYLPPSLPNNRYLTQDDPRVANCDFRVNPGWTRRIPDWLTDLLVDWLTNWRTGTRGGALDLWSCFITYLMSDSSVSFISLLVECINNYISVELHEDWQCRHCYVNMFSHHYSLLLTCFYFQLQTVLNLDNRWLFSLCIWHQLRNMMIQEIHY